MKTKYLTDISQAIFVNGIPEDLVINVDETGVCYSFTDGYTMEKCGSKQVKYTILALKNQLNALSLTV